MDIKLLSDDKLKHSHGVAVRCYDLAKKYGLDEDSALAAYCMGFLHDIGYAVPDPDITKHGQHGNHMLACMLRHKSDILNAIREHGVGAIDNIWARILNEADLSVDHKGDFVSFEDRIKSISERHGTDSTHTKHAVEMLDKIKQVE